MANLQTQHRPSAIARRLSNGRSPVYLGDVVLGSIDGCITSFAIISAAHGAGLSATLVVVLGLANIIADGYSMAVSNYQNVQADSDVLERLRREEAEHIALVPDGEREELRQIYAAKGLSGEALEQLVEAISSDVQTWITTMLHEEHKVSTLVANPLRAALSTFAAFVVFGTLPLLPFALFGSLDRMVYWLSAAVAAVCFFIVGAIKARAAGRSTFAGGLRVMAIGLMAASLALAVGTLASH